MTRRIKAFAAVSFALYASVLMLAFGAIIYAMTTCWRYGALMEFLKGVGLR